MGLPNVPKIARTTRMEEGLSLQRCEKGTPAACKVPPLNPDTTSSNGGDQIQEPERPTQMRSDAGDLQDAQP